VREKELAAQVGAEQRVLVPSSGTHLKSKQKERVRLHWKPDLKHAHGLRRADP
jgi:hypothetical protein